MRDERRGYSSRFIEFCERHYRAASAVVLSLAAFNLTFRLHREVLTEWDEALYAISAAETLARGNWAATTFFGELDYYNTKPPLNVWLIAASFMAFGPGLLSLRLPSIVSAWLTVLVLMLWARRTFGAAPALLAGTVLSTTFGFLYVHAARNANTDALFTLLMLLVAVTLWLSGDRPWRLVWLGPLLAGAFLLRGMGVLMPAAMIGAVILLDVRRLPQRLLPLLAATVLMAAPVGAWAYARWQVDQGRFFERMFQLDLVALSTTPADGHTGSVFYYLNVLQKDQYDWLLAAAAALILFPVSREKLSQAFGSRYEKVVAAAWIVTTLGIPTVIQTKLAWYLNPFFPIFAVLVGGALAHGFAQDGAPLARRRRILAGFLVLALAVAEAKLIWYSYNRRDLRLFAQGLLLDERQRLAGRRVFRDRWPNAGRFIVQYIIGGQPMEAEDEQDFLEKGRKGDFILLTPSQQAYANLVCVRSNHRYALCEYPDRIPVGRQP